MNVLNERPMVRIVVEYQGGGSISGSSGKLVLFPLNTTLGDIDLVIIKYHGL
jgi:hypothetical protein